MRAPAPAGAQPPHAALVLRTADRAGRRLNVVTRFMRGQQVKADRVVGDSGHAAHGMARVGRAAGEGEVVTRAELGAVAERHGLEHGIDAAAETGPFSDRADPPVKFQPVEQWHGRVVQGRVHQVGSARGEALAVDADIDPRSEQAAILDLAREGTIAHGGRAGKARDQPAGIRAVGRRQCVGIDRHGPGRVNRPAGDGDHVGQRCGVRLGQGRRGGEGRAERQDKCATGAREMFAVHGIRSRPADGAAVLREFDSQEMAESERAGRSADRVPEGP